MTESDSTTVTDKQKLVVNQTDSTEKEANEGVKDLSGDEVYDYLKQFVLPGYELIGGRIDERQIVMNFNQPRILITILTRHTESKQFTKKTFNYLKILRGIRSGKY